jgi:hypothetical protein
LSARFGPFRASLVSILFWGRRLSRLPARMDVFENWYSY